MAGVRIPEEKGASAPPPPAPPKSAPGQKPISGQKNTSIGPKKCPSRRDELENNVWRGERPGIYEPNNYGNGKLIDAGQIACGYERRRKNKERSSDKTELISQRIEEVKKVLEYSNPKSRRKNLSIQKP